MSDGEIETHKAPTSALADATAKDGEFNEKYNDDGHTMDVGPATELDILPAGEEVTVKK